MTANSENGAAMVAADGNRDAMYKRAFSAVWPPLAMVALIVAIWQMSYVLTWVNPFLLPSPAEVLGTTAETFADIVTGGRVTVHFFTTLNEIVVGFLLATILGTTLGALMSESRAISQTLYPYIVALNSTPKVALAPVFVAWFGFGQIPKIILVVLISVFPVVINTMAGLQSTDPQALRLMRAYGATRFEVLTKVKAKAALPFYFAGLELAIMSASIGAIVGEFTGGNRGLGYVAVLSQEALNVSRTFAVVLVLGIQGVILHRLIVMLGRKMVFWEHRSR